MREMILAPSRKKKSFNNLMKGMKFGSDRVDLLLNILQVSYSIFHDGPRHKSLNNSWASLDIIIFSCRCK